MKNNLKTMRKATGMTQQEVAEQVGVTRQTIILIEKGQYNPTLSLCLRICYVLEKQLDEVFWVERENFDEKNYR